MVNLAEQGLCALRYEDDDKARAFYDRHRPAVYVMDNSRPGDPISYYVYRDPGVDACLVAGIDLYRGEMPFDSDRDDITGDLTDAPDLPAEFIQRDQQSSPFDQIPNELKQHDQWVLWRYVERDGKRTKVPFQANGLSAKSNDSTTWTGFDRIKGKHDEGGFDGVGFVLSKHDGLTGIDLDKCYDPDTKQFTHPEAEEIVNRALELGTYVEISPSGSGFRIFVKGSLQRSGKAPGHLKWIEAYDYRSSRYLTVTGAKFEGADVEIQPGQEFLDWLYTAYLKRPEPTHQSQRLAPGSISPAAVDDDVLISQIRGSQNDGPRFTELFDQGRLINRETGELNDDHSSADFALCGILARWTERSAEQIGRIFRRSALMRDKWDERHSSDGRTYGEMTVEKAIANCAQTRKEWVDAQRQADRSYVTESLNAADPAVITSAEFASALYRVSQKDPLALIRWEKQGAFRLAKLSKKDVAQIVKEGARLSEDARTNLPYSTDVHPDIEAAIAELNAKFCVAWMGGDLNVMRFVVSAEHVNGGFVPTTKSDVTAWYANKLIEIPDAANNETIRINPASAWWSSKDRQEYDGVEFHPGKDKVIIQGGKRILNLWGGWAIDPLEGHNTIP